MKLAEALKVITRRSTTDDTFCGAVLLCCGLPSLVRPMIQMLSSARGARVHCNEQSAATRAVGGCFAVIDLEMEPLANSDHQIVRCVFATPGCLDDVAGDEPTTTTCPTIAGFITAACAHVCICHLGANIRGTTQHQQHSSLLNSFPSSFVALDTYPVVLGAIDPLALVGVTPTHDDDDDDDADAAGSATGGGVALRARTDQVQLTTLSSAAIRQELTRFFSEQHNNNRRDNHPHHRDVSCMTMLPPVVECQLPLEFLCPSCRGAKVRECTDVVRTLCLHGLTSTTTTTASLSGDKNTIIEPSSSDDAAAASALWTRAISSLRRKETRHDDLISRTIKHVVSAAHHHRSDSSSRHRHHQSSTTAIVASADRKWVEWAADRLAANNSKHHEHTTAGTATSASSGTALDQKKLRDVSDTMNLLFGSCGGGEVSSLDQSHHSRNNNNLRLVWERALKQQLQQHHPDVCVVNINPHHAAAKNKKEQQELNAAAYGDDNNNNNSAARVRLAVEEEEADETEAILKALTEKRESMTIARRAEEWIAHLSAQGVPAPLRGIALSLTPNMRFWLTPMGFISLGTILMMTFGVVLLFMS